MDFERVNIKGGSAYENVAGYSRIVKAGPFVYVSGTTSVTPEGTVYGEGDPYEQAKYIFNKLVGLLEENGVEHFCHQVFLQQRDHPCLFRVLQGKQTLLHMDRYQGTEPSHTAGGNRNAGNRRG